MRATRLAACSRIAIGWVGSVFFSELQPRRASEPPQCIHWRNELGGSAPAAYALRPRYDERQRLRLKVKPGLTGLAQLAGRNSLDWDARLELDALYAERVSILLDLRLILMTLCRVITREGGDRQRRQRHGRVLGHSGQATG